MNIPAINLSDGYKTDHRRQYPDGTTQVYSNFCPRNSRIDGVDSVVFFGLTFFLEEYLVKQYDNWFIQDTDYAVRAYKRRMDSYLGKDAVPVDHIRDLHELQYLPLLIKALPEGTVVPLQTPPVTIQATTTEILLAGQLPGDSPKLYGVAYVHVSDYCAAIPAPLELAAKSSGADPSMVKWQGHDFSFRGMFGVQAACMSGAAHLLSFTGTDTIPALDFIESYYGLDDLDHLLGGTVYATEHSVMCAGGKATELDTIRRLIQDVYPAGIVSVVSDTWDFWKVVTETLPALKEIIMSRDGKLVIRPDSGDPVKIICGDPEASTEAEQKGLIQCLWDIFGGTVNEAGFKVLDPHIGAIYGDSITVERAEQITSLLINNGFVSTSVVLGIGSYTYQYVTRDTFGWAMKATYAEVNGVGRELMKSPKTDSSKKSHWGLLRVNEGLTVSCGVSAQEEATGMLVEAYRDGFVDSTWYYNAKFDKIRTRIDEYVARNI